MNIRKINFSTNISKKNKVKLLKDSIKFMLIGNPNTGKTTFFNALTSSNEHVGNWHGVTVEEKEKNFFINDKEYFIVDLPGIYSLTPLSYEEEVATQYIFNNSHLPIINICDFNNLKRNLFLTFQLKEISDEIILFVNTFKNKINQQNIQKIKNILEKLKIKYFIGNANNQKDINKFKNLLLNIKYNKKNTVKLKEKYFKKNKNNFLNNNKNIYLKINSLFLNNDLKYKKAYGNSYLDKILLNKFFAFPIFFLILFLIFYLTFFSIGAWLSDCFRFVIQDIIGEKILIFLRTAFNVPWLINLIEVGILGGVGGVVSFLPQVVLLFLFLSILEDSGYLSRIAFLFEDIFAKVGLSGKSVYSLLMGFGCSTTASLTARNMEDQNSKIKTAILTPYMSCSAKLPIYAIIGGAFFGAANIFIIFSLYILGVIVALILSLILEKRFLKTESQSFILEFPAYRFPSVKRIFKIITENSKLFLIRIGTLIIAFNIIIWIFQSFSLNLKFVPTYGGKSILQFFGEILAPIFAPLGFGNWGATAALISGLVAKEIIVSSIAMFNGVNVFKDDLKNQTMNSILNPLSVVYFSSAGALSFMVFCLLYAPCFATISVLKKEIGKKWTIISVILQFAIAYFVSYLIFNFYRLFEGTGSFDFIFIIFGILVILISIYYLYKKLKSKDTCLSCKNKNTCNKQNKK